MEQTTHTPGPWRNALPHEGWGEIYAGNKQIAHVDDSKISLLECQANARLIAAAPELLEALDRASKMLYAWRSHYFCPEGYKGSIVFDNDTTHDFIRAAIAKTGGQS